MQKAAGTPVRIDATGASSAFERVLLGGGLHNEDWLQQLIFEHSELLPISEIEPGFGTAIPAAREVACGHGFIDNIYLTPAGQIILVEAKLWKNVQARRELVAQALDYVASLMTMSFEAFEAAVLKGLGANAPSLHAIVAAHPEALDEPAFIDAVSLNLRRGRMLVIGLGDGIRQEAEALAQLLQSHAGAHFTFALVELAVWRQPAAEELLIVPSTLARTVMIERGILVMEDGLPRVEPVLATQQPSKQSQTLSDVIFFEELAKVDPRLPDSVRSFLGLLEPLGVYPDLKASLNIKADLPERSKPVNFGYIAKNGQLWTNPFGFNAPRGIAMSYNQQLAELIGGVVSSGNEINVTTNGKTAPKVTALLPDHAEAWAQAIEAAIHALHQQEALPSE